MTRWEILFLLVCALLITADKVGVPRIDRIGAARVFLAAALFAWYSLVIQIGTSERKRTVSLFAQTLLGTVLALAIAAIFAAPIEGHVVAAAAGLLLGYFSDLWLKYLPWP